MLCSANKSIKKLWMHMKRGMVNVYGIINQATGSHTLAMVPLAILCGIGGIAVLVMGRKKELTIDVENSASSVSK